jgi:adenine/guanine phosphoribosyltransferase-like PRPP-binding protein
MSRFAESLGYLFGAPVAYLLPSRLVLARRLGKLAGATLRTFAIRFNSKIKSF